MGASTRLLAAPFLDSELHLSSRRGPPQPHVQWMVTHKEADLAKDQGPVKTSDAARRPFSRGVKFKYYESGNGWVDDNNLRARAVDPTGLGPDGKPVKAKTAVAAAAAPGAVPMAEVVSVTPVANNQPPQETEEERRVRKEKERKKKVRGYGVNKGGQAQVSGVRSRVTGGRAK